MHFCPEKSSPLNCNYKQQHVPELNWKWPSNSPNFLFLGINSKKCWWFIYNWFYHGFFSFSQEQDFPSYFSRNLVCMTVSWNFFNQTLWTLFRQRMHEPIDSTIRIQISQEYRKKYWWRMGFRRKNPKVRTRYNILIFPAIFSVSTGSRAIAARRAEWQTYQCKKIKNVVSSSDFEIFSLEFHALCNLLEMK